MTSESEEELTINEMLSHQKKMFVKKFEHYFSLSQDNLVDEFVGDRVFNLEMSRRLVLTCNLMTAKGAFSIFTSNKVMTEAMMELGIITHTDLLSSDLEIVCAVAFNRADMKFVELAVQIVIEYGTTKTGYNMEWFEEMGKKVDRKEKNRHSKVGQAFKHDTSLEPVGQLIGVLRSNAMVEPSFQFAQGGLTWYCECVFRDILFKAAAGTKVDSKKAVAVKILQYLEQTGV